MVFCMQEIIEINQVKIQGIYLFLCEKEETKHWNEARGARRTPKWAPWRGRAIWASSAVSLPPFAWSYIGEKTVIP